MLYTCLFNFRPSDLFLTADLTIFFMLLFPFQSSQSDCWLPHPYLFSYYLFTPTNGFHQTAHFTRPSYTAHHFLLSNHPNLTAVFTTLCSFVFTYESSLLDCWLNHPSFFNTYPPPPAIQNTLISPLYSKYMNKSV